MKIHMVKNQAEGAQVALEFLKDRLAQGAKTLGLATGSTPLAFYEALLASDLDFSDLVSINLDEYVGLSADHEQSYSQFMEQHLFKAKPFKQSYLPNGLANDLEAEVSRYEEILEQHPLDFQLLGIGRNGHIGFNEPGTAFDTKTHVVDLTASTIEANSRFFEDSSQVPRQAISMGIGSIREAKSIVLMAYGQDKADAVAAMVKGPVTEDLPASILQKHEQVLVILDEQAASKL